MLPDKGSISRTNRNEVGARASFGLSGAGMKSVTRIFEPPSSQVVSRMLVPGR
jgi:hypothetical protein